jgi:hypothetical protein
MTARRTPPVHAGHIAITSPGGYRTTTILFAIA